MSTIKEESVFTESVRLLTTDMKVIGADPNQPDGDVGPANYAAKDLADRTKWLKEKVGDLEELTNQKLADLDESTTGKIAELDNSLLDKLGQLKDELNENISTLDKSVDSRIETQSKETETKLSDLDTSLSTKIETVTSDTDKKLSDLSDGVDEKLKTASDNTDKKITDKISESEGNTDEKLTALKQSLTDTITQTDSATNERIDTLSSNTAKQFEDVNNSITDQTQAAKKDIDEELTTLSSEVFDSLAQLSIETDIRFTRNTKKISGLIESVSAKHQQTIDFYNQVSKQFDQVNDTIKQIDFTTQDNRDEIDTLKEAQATLRGLLSQLRTDIDSNTQNINTYKTANDKALALKQDVLSDKNLKTINQVSLLGEGDMVINPDAIGADKKGQATAVLQAHVAEDDPHTQYLTEERGDNRYVQEDVANKAQGYLKLNEKGQIPAEFVESLQVKYKAVNNKEERLALPQSDNTTICLQLDENAMFYLNGGEDPSVEENWVEGRISDPAQVNSVFGRGGDVVAQAGDYSTDQITETDKRVFVSPADKATWSGKQDKLQSGVGIKTLNEGSLLGEGNITIDVDTLGAATKKHKHTATDIVTTDDASFVTVAEKASWDAKQPKLVSRDNIATVFGQPLLQSGNIDLDDVPDLPKIINNLLSSNSNVSSSIDESTNKIILKAPESLSNDITIYEVVAKYHDVIHIPQKTRPGFNFRSYIFQNTSGDAAATLYKTYKDSDFEKSPYPTTNSLGYFPADTPIIKETLKQQSNDWYTIPVDDIKAAGTYAVAFAEAGGGKGIVPTFTDSDPMDGYTPFASSYRSAASEPWVAFKAPLVSSSITVANQFWASNNNFVAEKTGCYIGIQCPKETVITAYTVGAAPLTGTVANTYTYPRSWEFQGSHNGEDWVTVNTQKNLTIANMGVATFYLDSQVSYTYYRMRITDVVNQSMFACLPRLQLCNDSPLLIKAENNARYRVTAAGALEKVTATNVATFNKSAFLSTVSYPPVTLEKLNTLGNWTIESIYPGTVSVYCYKQAPMIVLNKHVDDEKIWGVLNKINITSDATWSGKVAFTLNGTDFYVLRDGSWLKVSSYTNDAESAKKIVEEGMPTTEVSAITNLQWSQLMTLEEGIPYFGIAFGREVPNTAASVCPKTVNYSFNATTEWRLLSPALYTLALTDRSIKITFNQGGEFTYKICYAFY